MEVSVFYSFIIFNSILCMFFELIFTLFYSIILVNLKSNLKSLLVSKQYKTVRNILISLIQRYTYQ
jgi:hypothetical protein